ncbi:MAG TPA: ribosome recycling factor [Candidatus Berkiella sp.]|nr:ribosome recycling factor [Candidatus Berkiella sp.]
MINDIQKNAKERMTKSLHSLEEELSKLRAGRANPSILEGVVVSYYGADTPLTQVAQIVVEGALMLAVKPFEKRLVPEIEKAIRAADLGLNPATSGDVIRVPFPPLSEERRKELIKKVKAEVESAKVAVRNIRRDANQEIKDLLKERAISEDEQRKAEEAMQKLTDQYIHQADAIFARKEKDLMEI